MTPQERKDFILALPNDHPARIAFLVPDDELCASLLSALTQPGYVPTVEIGRWMYDLGVYGRASIVASGPVPTVPEEQQFYALCKTIMGMLRDLPDVNVLAEAFQTGLAVFTSIGWITQEVSDQITALANNRLPILQSSPSQIGDARNLTN